MEVSSKYSSAALQKYVAAGHNFCARGLAETYGLHYQSVNKYEKLETAIEFLMQTEATRPVLVEVFTEQ